MHIQWRGTGTSLVLGALFALVPAALQGQACVGNTALPGQAMIEAGASFTDGAWALGGGVGGNFHGPAFGSAGVSHIMFDNTDLASTGVGGAVGVELEGLDFSLCPAVGVGYQWLSNDAGTGVDADGVVLGGGIGLGGRIESESGLVFVPFGGAQVVHNRASASFGGFTATESETYGVFSGGVALGGGSVYGGPSVAVSTLEGSDPVFTLSLGVLLGG